MKIIFKWLRNKLQQAAETEYLSEGSMKKAARIELSSPSISRLDANGMNFSVHKANGGYVIQYSLYDRRNDRTDIKLHIITDDQDLGEELGKIISFEALRA